MKKVLLIGLPLWCLIAAAPLLFGGISVVLNTKRRPCAPARLGKRPVGLPTRVPAMGKGQRRWGSRPCNGIGRCRWWTRVVPRGSRYGGS